MTGKQRPNEYSALHLDKTCINQCVDDQHYHEVVELLIKNLTPLEFVCLTVSVLQPNHYAIVTPHADSHSSSFGVVLGPYPEDVSRQSRADHHSARVFNHIRSGRSGCHVRFPSYPGRFPGNDHPVPQPTQDLTNRSSYQGRCKRTQPPIPPSSVGGGDIVWCLLSRLTLYLQ